VLPSLSRLQKESIGEGYTRDDHPDVANQVFSAYSRVQDVRSLAQVIGEDDISEMDKKYMEFGRQFEQKFLNQGFEGNRSMVETLNTMWELLRVLPRAELDRVKPEMLDKYYNKGQ